MEMQLQGRMSHEPMGWLIFASASLKAFAKHTKENTIAVRSENVLGLTS